MSKKKDGISVSQIFLVRSFISNWQPKLSSFKRNTGFSILYYEKKTRFRIFVTYQKLKKTKQNLTNTEKKQQTKSVPTSLNKHATVLSYIYNWQINSAKYLINSHITDYILEIQYCRTDTSILVIVTKSFGFFFL